MAFNIAKGAPKKTILKNNFVSTHCKILKIRPSTDCEKPANSVPWYLANAWFHSLNQHDEQWQLKEYPSMKPH